MKFKILKYWDSSDLARAVETFLDRGWELHGDTFTTMETRNHAVTGEEYTAPMYCQSIKRLTPPTKGTK